MCRCASCRRTGVCHLRTGSTDYKSSGGWMGVSPERIIAETESLNTEQNARNVKAILQENGFQSPILVTSAFHMPRVEGHKASLCVWPPWRRL